MPADLWPADPLVVRKATLASVLAKAAVAIRFNEHMEFDDGEIVFYHACKLGLEGHRVQAAGPGLSLWSLAGLAQDEEPGACGGAARGGGGLGR